MRCTELALYWADHASLQLGNMGRAFRLKAKLSGGPFLFPYRPLHLALSLLRGFRGWPWVGLRLPERLAATFPFCWRLRRRCLASGWGRVRVGTLVLKLGISVGLVTRPSARVDPS